MQVRYCLSDCIGISGVNLGRVVTVREKCLEDFPNQGKVRECCGWPGKFRKDLESQGKVREFEKKMAMAIFRKFIYFVQKGKECTFS